MTTMHAPGRVRSLSSPPGRRDPAVPRRAAFWLVALVLAVTMLGTTLPTPLYVIYQGRWLTFAILLAALCLFSVSRFARGVR